MWRSASFSVLYVLATWTVPKRMAVAYEVHLITNTKPVKYIKKRNFNSFLCVVSITYYLWLPSWIDVNIFCINITVDVLIWMDILQDVQLQKGQHYFSVLFRKWVITDEEIVPTIRHASCRTVISDKSVFRSFINDWRDWPMFGKIRNLQNKSKEKTSSGFVKQPHQEFINKISNTPVRFCM